MNYYIFDREKDDLLRDDGERICFKSHVEVYNYLSKDCQFTNEFISSNYFIMRGEKILTVDSTDYSEMMPKAESVSVNDPSVLHNALKRLVDLKDLKDREGKSGYYETHQPAAWKQAREALAQYTAQSLPESQESKEGGEYITQDQYRKMAEGLNKPALKLIKDAGVPFEKWADNIQALIQKELGLEKTIVYKRVTKK